MSEDFREGLEGLQADMAAHQTRFGREVTAEQNNWLAVEAIRQLDRQRAESAAPATPQVSAPVAYSLERKVDGVHGQYIVEKTQDSAIRMRKASKVEHEWFQRAMPRVYWLLEQRESGLLGAPSWRARTLAVLKYRQDAISLRKVNRIDEAETLEKIYVLKLEELLDASSAPFGDWRKLAVAA